MPIQTSYTYYPSGLLQGMLADLETKDSVTGYAAAAISFGLGLVYDGAQSGDRTKVKVPTAAGQLFVGVSVFDHTRPLTGEVDTVNTVTSTQDAKYAIGDPIRILKRGRIWVYSEQAVSPSDTVFLRHTANGAGTAAGQFRKDIDTANAISLTGLARFASSTTAAGLVIVEVNIP